MTRKTLLLSFLVTVLSIMATAQAHYNTTQQYYLTDNSVNCRTRNCYLPVSDAPAVLTQISTGFDLSVYGVDAAGNIYNLPDAGGSTKPVWSKMTNMAISGNPAKWVAVRSATEIYGGFQNGCGVTPQMYRWDGSTWHIMSNQCLDEMSITSDDTAIGINKSTGGTLWFTTTPQASTFTWTQVSNGWSHVAGSDSTLAFGIVGTTLYSINLSTKVATAFPNTGPVNQVAVTSDQKLFVITVTPGSNGNTWVFDQLEANPVWHNLPGGNCTSLWGSTSSGIFALNGTVTPYHYLETALAAQVNINGWFDCSYFPSGQCPAGSYHTAIATVGFPHGYFKGAQASDSGAPAQTLNATASDTSGLCDPLFGDPNNPECFLQTSTGNVNCSAMGNILSMTGGGSGPIFGHIGTELAKNLSGTGTGLGCYKTYPNGLKTLCIYKTTPSCSNVTPTYPITEIHDGPPGPTGGWWVVYKCDALGTPVQTCYELPGLALKTTDPGPSNNCKNPY